MGPAYGGKTAFHTQIRGASQRINFDQQHLLLRFVDPSKMKAAQPFKALMGRPVTGCRFHQSRERRTIFKQCAQAQTKLGFHSSQSALRMHTVHITSTHDFIRIISFNKRSFTFIQTYLSLFVSVSVSHSCSISVWKNNYDK